MRVHRITHPILGITTWAEMQKAVAWKKLCSWCHKPVPPGKRTRCSDPHCHEMIWQAQSWQRCVRICMRTFKYKCKCGAGATEVDHIVPVSLGGTGDQSNLRAICHACHNQATALLRKLKEKYVAA